jgi:NTE family protein
MASEPAGTVGLVLAGGGARGAYEAAVLSVLLPALERRGESPRIVVGTSVGAISCAFVAANAHLGAEATGRAALERWRQVEAGRVMRSLVGRVPLTVLEYTGEFLHIPGVRVQSLADTTPLRATLDEWIDWPQIAANVAGAHLQSAGVVATAARSGRTTVFLDSDREPPPDGDKLRYVRTPLGNEHVRASAAIPIAFPPVRVEAPEAARGWYLDGGTRLNTPIKPVIDQGADRVVVIALDSVEPPGPDEPDDGPPDFGDAALHLLQGALVDPLVEDVRTLAKINALAEERPAAGYRPIPYIFIAPEHRGTIGELATEVFHEHFRGLRRLRSPDMAALEQLLGGRGPSQGALMSLLFFEPHFVERLIELGRRDAERWLAAAGAEGGPWHMGPLEERPGRLPVAARTPA